MCHKHIEIFLTMSENLTMFVKLQRNTHLHANASLRAIALCLDSQEGDEGVDGALGSHDGIAGRGAQRGEGIQALQGVDEQHDVMDS